MSDDGVVIGLLATVGVLGVAGIRSRMAGSRSDTASPPPPPPPPPPPTRYERVKQGLKKGAKKGLRTSVMPLGPDVARVMYGAAGGAGVTLAGAPYLAPVAGAAGTKLIDAVDWATRQQEGSLDYLPREALLRPPAGVSKGDDSSWWMEAILELLLYALPKLVAGGHRALCRPGGIDRAVDTACSPVGLKAYQAVLTAGLIPLGPGAFMGPKIARYVHTKFCSTEGRSVLRFLFGKICTMPSEEVEKYASVGAQEIARHA